MAFMLLFFFLNKSLKSPCRPIDKNGSLVTRQRCWLDGTIAATSASSATAADANDLDGPELAKHLQENATR